MEKLDYVKNTELPLKRGGASLVSVYPRKFIMIGIFT